MTAKHSKERLDRLADTTERLKTSSVEPMSNKSSAKNKGFVKNKFKEIE